MEEILLAIGHKDLEDYIKLQLGEKYEFVGEVVYKEAILTSVKQKNPDIVIIRETLPGKPNIMSIVYEIRANFQDIRIIFLAGNRKVGDELLTTLVNYGIYDILHGENILAQELIALIEYPNTYNDIKYLQPVPLLDENRNKVLFEPPEAEIRTEVIEVTKEIVIGDAPVIKNREYPIERESDTQTEDNKGISIKNPFKEIMKLPRINLLKETSNIPKEVNHGNRHNTDKQKIITFVGGKHGVGTTSLAVNTAFLLAERGNKVVFVELNDINPSVSYWYELGLVDEGIDTFVNYLAQNEYSKIEKALIKGGELKKKESPMKKSYKKYPDTIDFLFFSKEYISGLNKRELRGSIKEMYLYLLYQMGYDFVVLDVSPDISNKEVQDALVFSNIVFSVITQDVSTVGYHLFNLNALEKTGINILSKNNYIVNKYVNSSFHDKEIKKWIEVDKLFIVPNYSREFIEANIEGLPVVIGGKNIELTSYLKEIASASVNNPPLRV